MPTYDWTRKLLKAWKLKRSRRKQRFSADSLVPQLSIKRLEERLVLNADAAPVEVLVVNAGDASGDGQADIYHVQQEADYIHVSVNGQELYSAPVGTLSAIHVNGSADNDVLVADLLAGVDLVFDGGGGEDTLSIHGGQYDQVAYEFGDDSAGQIEAQSASGVSKIDFQGVEKITDSLATLDREFSLEGPERHLTLSDPADTQDSSRLTIAAGNTNAEHDISVDFLNPTESLMLDTTHGDSEKSDRVEVTGLGDGFNANFHVIGSANDLFELSGNIDLGSSDFHVSTGSIVLNGGISSDHAEVSLNAHTDIDIHEEATIENDGGQVRVAAPEITLQGTISAAAGFVELDSGDHGVTFVEGIIDVSDPSEGGHGGVVHVLGGSVGVMEGAQLSAVGNSGGGTILIGGGYQGSEPAVRNANYTYVGDNVLLNADAIVQGTGGKIIVWANEATRYYGDASARGGEQAGDGGFVEVSGKHGLVYQGTADLRAAAGEWGTLLLDPTNISISNAVDLNVSLVSPFVPLLAGASNLLIATLQAALLLGDVTVQTANFGAANGDLSLLNNIDINGLGILRTLTFIAHGNIEINGTISDSNTVTADRLNIVLTANSDGVGGGNIDINADITTRGGSLTATGVDFDSTGQLINTSGTNNANGGAVSITATGLATVGAITTSAGTDVGGGGPENAGNVALVGTDVTIVGAINALGGNDAGDNAPGGTGGTIAINATDGTPLITIGANINSSGGSGSTVGAGGAITFNDNVVITAAIEISVGEATLVFNENLSAGANDLTLTGDEINFTGGANSVSGTGALTLQTAENSDAVSIGIASGVDDNLNLNDTELAALADGFTSITIGRATGQHSITVGSATFKDSVTIRTPSGGSVQVNGLLDTLAGSGSITIEGGGTTTTTLNANIVTAGGAISVQSPTTLGAATLLDTTNAGAALAGANINLTIVTGGGNNLTLNAGTAGVVTVTGAATGLGTLTLTRAASFTFQNNLTATTLVTTANDYDLTLLGASNTITTDTSFLNTGTLNFGDAAGDVFRFNGGVDTTIGPTLTNLHGQLRTSADQIDLGLLTLLGNSQIDSTNAGADAAGANINLDTVTGDGFDLTINAGTAGDVRLLQVGAAGASLDVLSVTAETVNLNANVVADAQTFTANVEVSEALDLLLDTTDGGALAAGGAIGITGTLRGTAAGVGETLRVNAGTAGDVTIGSVNDSAFTLTILNSDTTTITGSATLATLNIQNTSDSVTLQGSATIDTLTTTANGYDVALLGSANTIATATSFLNTGTVRFGNADADTFLFNGGVDTTTGPTLTNLHGQLRTSGDLINLGTLTLLGNSQIDSTNLGANAAGANIILDTVAGNGFDLTINAGTAGDVRLLQVGSAGASLDVLSVTAETVNLNANIVADTQTFTANVQVSESLDLLLDATDGGADAAGGAIGITGTLRGTAAAVAETLRINAGTGGDITIGAVNDSAFILTIVNSDTTTITGAAILATLNIQNTVDVVTIQGNATIDTLVTTGNNYDVTLLGTSNSIATATNFLNTGTVRFGNADADTFLFDGGVDTTTGPTLTNLHGQLRTSADLINLGSLTLLGNSQIDTTNAGVALAGANIDLTIVTGGGNNLALNAGTAGVVTVTGAATGLGTLTLTRAASFTFQNNLTANTLVTTANDYDLTLLGASNTITTDTSFLNTGTLNFGDAAGDVFRFNGGIDTTIGPTLTNLHGQIRTSADQIDLGLLTLLGNSQIDSTNAGADAAGANINLDTVAGDGFDLTINAGTAGDVRLLGVGAAGASLDVFSVTAETVNLNANVVADAQTFTANVEVNEALDLLLDTTDGGALAAGGAIGITGTLRGTAAGVGETLRVNAGTAGDVTIGSVNDSAFTLVILNSDTTTITGSTTLATLNIQNTTDSVTLQGSATIDTLTTTANGYDVALLGSANTIATATSFLNTGTVRFGNADADTFLFNGGVDTTTGPTLTNLHGQLRTSGDLINLGTLTLLGNSQIDSTNVGANLGDPMLPVTTISLNGLVDGTVANSENLELNAGVNHIVLVGPVGSITRLGTLSIASAGDVVAFDTIAANNFLQSTGSGTTLLIRNVSATNAVDLRTNTIRLDGFGVEVTVAARTIKLDATSGNFLYTDFVLDTTSNPLAANQGVISDEVLAPGALVAMKVGPPLAPPGVTVANVEVMVNDSQGKNFVIYIDWRLADRLNGVPAPGAVAPVNLDAIILGFSLDGAVLPIDAVNPTQPLMHEYDDNPESDPSADIRVEVSINSFANDAIQLLNNGTSILADSGIAVTVLIPADGFTPFAVPLPAALPISTPPPLLPALATTPAPLLTSINAEPFEQSSAGATSQGEVRFYQLRIFSFDEATNEFVESSNERINLSEESFEAIAPFDPSKLPELFKRLPGDRYRIYLIEDGTERLMIEFVIEQVGDEGHPVELPETSDTQGQVPANLDDTNLQQQPADPSAAHPVLKPESSNGEDSSFAERLGRASFISSGGVLFGAAMLSKPTKQSRETQADRRMAAFRKKMRTKSRENVTTNSSDVF